MPLVVFNYDSSFDGVPADGVFEEVMELPKHWQTKKWTLRSVNALSSQKQAFSGVEVSFPEIMTTQNILFSNVSDEGVDLPKDVFRFYPKSYQLSEDVGDLDRTVSAFSVVSEYPNLNLGEHRLENFRLTCSIKAIGGHAGSTAVLSSSCVILSAEE